MYKGQESVAALGTASMASRGGWPARGGERECWGSAAAGWRGVGRAVQSSSGTEWASKQTLLARCTDDGDDRMTK